MKNWMLKLEDHLGSDDAKLAIQVLAAALIVATIIVGNWYFVF